MKRKNMVAIGLSTLALIGYVAYGINHIVSSDIKMRHSDVQLELKSAEVKQLELDAKALNSKLEQELQKNEVDEKTRQELEQKNQELQQRNKELEISKANREAEKQRIANAARDALDAVTGTGTAYVAGGNKDIWLAASGIPSSEWWAVDYIVSHESGWNPCAYNPGKSNCNLTAQQVNDTQGVGVACGLGQSLPCGKWGANWTDPVAQLKAMNTYVNKFGGWAGAVSYWKANGHY